MPGRKKAGARVRGPTWLPSREQWRVIVVGSGGGQSLHYYRDQGTARAFAEKAQRRIGELRETKLNEALITYREHLVVARRNKPKSADDTVYRIERFFPNRAIRMRAITPARCRSAHEELKQQPRAIRLAGGKTKEGPPLSPDSRLNILSTVRTFLDWCVGKNYIDANPVKDLRDDAIRNEGGFGECDLSDKELRTLYTHAMNRAAAGDERALGVLMALVLGMRSNEICRCQVRFVDELLWTIKVPRQHAKTRKSIRTFEVPPGLRPMLLRQIEGKSGEQLLFPARPRPVADGDNPVERPHDRGWVSKSLAAMCKALKFPVIENAHGLRGAHNDLARARGRTGYDVEAQLGHENEKTSERSYTSDIGRRAMSAHHTAKVLSVLEGGKAAGGG